MSTAAFDNFILMSQPTYLASTGAAARTARIGHGLGVGTAALGHRFVMPRDIEGRKRRWRRALTQHLAELAEAGTGKRFANWEARMLP